MGMISGAKEGKTIGLRADMDALPIEEKNTHDFVSKKQGIMHACGHDVHIACLLGAAKILYKFKDTIKGNIKLIFQPSEENFPGGAIEMIKEGVLENPKVDFMLGQHVFPQLESGEISIKSGKLMASTDEIYINVIGKGGHGATPHLNTDPVVIASQIIIALQQLISRNNAADNPCVLSFGRFIADGKTNIIPDTVQLEGTLRCFNENWREKAHKRITEIAEKTADAMQAKAEVRIDKGYPFLINNEALSHKLNVHFQNVLGKEKIKEIDLQMTAEDFAYFSHQLPSCFIKLGCANKEKNITANLHNACFDIDENSLYYGSIVLASAALHLLSKNE
jgi:amidohydrolase